MARSSQGKVKATRAGRQSAKKPKVILVFGESINDVKSVASLVRALRADLKVVPLRSPSVLIHERSGNRQNIAKNAEQIRQAALAASVEYDVRALVLHKDCDAVEPAHIALAAEIEGKFVGTEFKCIAATPAWEIESWWYLWPQAVSSYRSTWAGLGRAGTNIGLVRDSKEVITRELRPKGARTRDYVESDSMGIAEKVLSLGCVAQHNVSSNSFSLVAAKVSAVV